MKILVILYLLLLNTNYILPDEEIICQEGSDCSAIHLNGSLPFVTLACRYKDITSMPYTIEFLNNMYFNTGTVNGIDVSLNSFWKTISYNNINLNGSKAIGNSDGSWLILPKTKAEYTNQNGSLDYTNIQKDCVSVADPYINYSNYYGIQVVVNSGGSDCIGGIQNYKVDGISKDFGVTFLPSGCVNLKILEHEMGHAMRLPHTNTALEYSNYWDVMANTSYHLTHPTYGCSGQHTNSLHKKNLGWIQDSKILKIAYSNGRQDYTLDAVSDPRNSNPLSIYVNNAYSYYLIEARPKYNFDYNTPCNGNIICTNYNENPAVIIYKVDNLELTSYTPVITIVGELYLNEEFQDPNTSFYVKFKKTNSNLSYTVTIQSADTPEEYSILEEFYTATNGDDWFDRTNWLSNELICNWKGIICNNETIVSISFGNNNLNGYIPSSLFTILGLEYIGVQGNKDLEFIEDSIVDNLSLNELEFYGNGLNGNLPESLSKLTNLYRLDLRSNEFSGSLPSSFNNIGLIFLDNNHLTGSISKSFCDGGMNTLFLSGNSLSGKIPDCLLDSNLEEINLSFNALFTTNPELNEYINGINEDGYEQWKETQALAPTNFQATLDELENSISLYWDEYIGDLEGYNKIYVNSGSGPIYFGRTDSLSENQFKISNVQFNQLYQIYVTTFIPSNKHNKNNLESEPTQTIKISGGNLPPQADVTGSTQYSYPSEEIVLQGTKSYDPEGKPLKYHWTQISGKSATPRSNPNSDTYWVKLPIVTVPQTLKFKLTVTDEIGQTDEAIAYITIYPFRIWKEILND